MPDAFKLSSHSASLFIMHTLLPYNPYYGGKTVKSLTRIKAVLISNSPSGIVLAKIFSGVCYMTQCKYKRHGRWILIWLTVPSAVHECYAWCEYHSHFQCQFAVVPIVCEIL